MVEILKNETNAFLEFASPPPTLKKIQMSQKYLVATRLVSNIPTKNNANDVIKPSFVSSQGPPYSSSSIFWKFVK